MFSGNDPNQDATSLWNSVENKILFSLGTRPRAPAAQTSYDKRQQSFFGSLLTDTALEWFESEVTDATDWNTLKDDYIKASQTVETNSDLDLRLRTQSGRKEN